MSDTSFALPRPVSIPASPPPCQPSFPPPRAPQNARVTVAVASVGGGPPRNMLRPFDMFVRGFGDERYHVLREEHLAGGKGYSIRIPPEPEPCAEFLPSDKSRQQVTVKRDGRGLGGEGGSVNSILPERNGALCKGWASTEWPSLF